MIAPFFDDASWAISLALAAIIGIAFGWTLERAGLGSARKLVGQFYFTDFTVFKVMFTAILVAMLGVFWLGRAGVLDISRVHMPETFLAPQLLGGALFGIGFVVAGLCPGTSCVAAATGRVDGASVVLGMFAGVAVGGLAFDPTRVFDDGSVRGAATLPGLLGLSTGVVVCAVVVLALLAFRGIAWIERRRA